MNRHLEPFTFFQCRLEALRALGGGDLNPILTAVRKALV